MVVIFAVLSCNKIFMLTIELYIMNWHHGSVADGVQKTKRENCLLIVYVRGNDTKSRLMDDVWNDLSVTEIFSQNPYVAMRLESPSAELTQFSSIYPVLIVPSTYFISPAGICLEVAAGVVEAPAFVDRIKKAIQMHQAQLAAPNTQATTAASSSSSEQSTNDVITPSSSSPPPPAQPASSLGDRVAHVQHLIEQNRARKEAESHQAAQSEELERRDLGRQMQQFKERQKQQEIEEEARKRRQSKLDDMKYREQLRQQIAMDRAEQVRNRKVALENEGPGQPQQSTSAARVRSADTGTADSKCRLQFRLPDGSSLLGSFVASQTLDDARSYLVQETNGKFGKSPVLATLYPRHTFAKTEYSASLLDLNLVPSSVLVVIGQGGQVTTVANADLSLWAWILYLLHPLKLLWIMLTSFVSGTTAPANTRSVPADKQQPNSRAQGDRMDESRATAGDGFSVQRQGNINKFRNVEDDPDEQARYNGNSTQQM